MLLVAHLLQERLTIAARLTQCVLSNFPAELQSIQPAMHATNSNLTKEKKAGAVITTWYFQIGHNSAVIFMCT